MAALHHEPSLRIVGLTRLLAALALGCGGPPAASTESAAKVDRVVNEADLGRITLSDDAVRRLGIALVAAERKTVPAYRQVPGEIAPRPSASVIVTANVSGVLLSAGGKAVEPGARVHTGDTIFRLVPMVTPNRNLRVEVLRDVEMARTRAAVSRQKAERFALLGQEGAGDRGASEAAAAEAKVAESELAAAEQRLGQLGGRDPLLSDVTGALRAPFSGVLQRVFVASGQPVGAGDKVFEILDPERLWVRAEIFVGALSEVDREAPALLSRLGAAQGSGVQLLPAKHPELADPERASASLFYELSGTPDHLLPGERVIVHLPIAGASEAQLVVPRAALLHDVHGNAWVYTSPSPGTYARARITLLRVVGDAAVASDGPAPGTPIVTTGAAELFGVELGHAK